MRIKLSVNIACRASSFGVFFSFSEHLSDLKLSL